MRKFVYLGAALLALAVALAATAGIGSAAPANSADTKLSLVAYSTPRAAYGQLIPAFQKTADGKDVSFTQSYGASGDQARAVKAGLDADIVALSLAPDMDELVAAGKVRFVGASTYPAWKVMEGLAVAREQGLPSYVSEQPPYNLLDRRIENELVPLCRTYELAILPWSPLAAGILAGRYDSADTVPESSRAARREPMRQRITDAGLEVARQLGELARERGLTTSQLALLWVKDQPGVTAPIVGPRTMAQLDDALGILDRALDDDARAACDELVHPGNAVSDFHNTTGWIKASV